VQRELRLNEAQVFQQLRDEGRKGQHSLLFFSYLPNDLEHNRYGFIVTKRLGQAVVRNRVRRRLREVVRLLHPYILQGYDMVFIPRPFSRTAETHQLRLAVISVLRQARLWEGE